jgi:uncharacterized protein
MPDDFARRHRQRQRGTRREGYHAAGATEAIAGLGPPAAGDGCRSRRSAGGGVVGAPPGIGGALHRAGAVRTGGEPARLVLAPQPGVRVVLLGLLGVSSGFFVMLLRGQLPPSLALHTLLDLA